MKLGKRVGYLIVGVLMLVAACAAPMNDIPEVETPVVETPMVLPDAVIQAQQYLAEQFGVSVTEIQVLETEQVDWPDACLGLPDEGEVCAQVVTPGWRVLAEVNGQTYELRTDETGAEVRLAEEIEDTAGN